MCVALTLPSFVQPPPTPPVKPKKRTTPYPFTVAVCIRLFMVMAGDVHKIAAFLGTTRALVSQCLLEHSLTSSSPLLCLPAFSEHEVSKFSGHILKNHATKKIHAQYDPCDHEGPCVAGVCSCVDNVHFCTKHCVSGFYSRNFFAGCTCKRECNTKVCPCFAAKRECDPDVCIACETCSDPVGVGCSGDKRRKQKCRNDNVGMKRSVHLMVAHSGIPEAGWGLYTKDEVKRDDFISEYIGEIISQEEADRRGRIYDKLNRSYLFNLNSENVVDATRKGNKSKFANHKPESQHPNCYTKVMVVNGDHRIGLFAKEDIPAQTELFFDYRYEIGLEDELLTLEGKKVDWMKDKRMANKISKKAVKKF